MSALFKKLNLKDQQQILVLNAPAGFEQETSQLQNVKILTSAGRVKQCDFALVFATRQAEVDRLTGILQAITPGDPIVWFAYPKASSRNYQCDFNRDTGWASMRAAGFDTVRMVAIDEDWSALRFRRKEFIGK